MFHETFGYYAQGVTETTAPPATTQAFKDAPRTGEAKMSSFIMSGVW